MTRRRRLEPWRVAMIAGLTAIAVGVIVGIFAIHVINPGGDTNARWERLGEGLGRLAPIIAVVAYLVAARRGRGEKDDRWRTRT